MEAKSTRQSPLPSDRGFIEDYFSVTQAAKKMGVSRQQVHKYINGYSLSVVRHPAMLFIHRSELEKIPKWKNIYGRSER